MNWKRYAGLSAALTVALAGLGLAGAERAHGAVAPSQALLVAHRGYLGWGAPENTHASMRHAVAADFGGVEFDVRLTSDRRAVLLHDSTLDRTTTCSGAVSKISLAKLAACDASSPTIKAKVPTYASTTAYLDSLSDDIEVFVHVKVRLDAKAAAGLVKGARSLSSSAKRVVFMIEENVDRKALAKAGWTGRFGLMVHTTSDWALATSGAYRVAVPYDAPSGLQDAVLTPSRLAALADAHVRVYALAGYPQSQEALDSLGVTRFFV